MATIAAKKSVFEMNDLEFEELVKPVALKAKQTALDNGAWFSYKNELCTEPDMFIHEFKDGHKELIKLGSGAGQHTVLKVF
jgi:hypothetical protein